MECLPNNLNSLFVEFLAERLGEKFSVTYGLIVNYTRTRIQISKLRAGIICIKDKIKDLNKVKDF